MKLTKTYSLVGTVDERLPSVSYVADEAGTFEALVSVVGNTDLQGDIVMAHAFDASLNRWMSSGKSVPCVWAHSWNDPYAIIGKASPFDIRELGPGEDSRAPRGGLLIKGKFDLQNEFANQVYRLVRDRIVDAWSFSYDVVRQRKNSSGANELLQLDLLEFGPCLVAANPETMTFWTKAANAIAPAVVTGDGRLRCSNCQRYTAIAMKPQTVFGGETVFVGACTSCGALQGFSPNSWSPAKNAAALAEIRGRAVQAILKTLRDGNAPPAVIESAEASAQYCLDDPDGYLVAEFADRVKDLTDSSIVNCFDTRAEAEAQMRALYASEKNDEPPAHKSSVQDRDLLAQLDELDGGEKRRNQSPIDDRVSLQEHLRQRHANQFDPAAVNRMSLSELRTAHVVAHPDGNVDFTNDEVSFVDPSKSYSPALKAFLAEDRRARASEKAAADAQAAADDEFRKVQEMLLDGPLPSEAERDARDAERVGRELAERERRDREREIEADHQDLSDQISRTRNWHGESYWEPVGATPVPRTESAPLDDAFTVTDGVTVEPDTFRIPLVPKPDPTFRVEEPDDGDTLRLPVGQTPTDKKKETTT
jgi:HK97 family phage prohead protease